MKPITLFLATTISLAIASTCVVEALAAVSDLTPDESEQVKLSSGKWSVAGMKAEKLVTAKKYAEAEAIYTDILNQRKALKLDLLPTYESLGRIYELQGKNDKAEEVYKAMLAQREAESENFDNQTTEYPLQLLSKLYKKTNRAKEAKALDARVAKIEHDMMTVPKFGAIKTAPHSPERLADAKAMREKGEKLVKADNQAIALYYFQRAVALDPLDAQAWCDLGDTQWFKENVPQAKIAYQKAITLNPKLSKAYIGRAWLREGVKDYKGAIADFDKAIEIDSTNYEAMGDRAKLLDNMGRHKEAVEGYTRIITAKPDLYWPYVQRSTAYANLKDYSHALGDLTALIKRAPQDGDYYEFRSQVYKQMGDKASAAADMAMMKKLNQP